MSVLSVECWSAALSPEPLTVFSGPAPASKRPLLVATMF
jgi:hypothetical protein